MTDEDVKFCATIASAARKLGISQRSVNVDGATIFEWYDPVGTIIKSEPNKAKDEAYFDACKKLAKYLRT